jgi:hypothetical protein
MGIREQLPLADRSTYELVEQLCNDGWECMVARTSALQSGVFKQNMEPLRVAKFVFGFRIEETRCSFH